MLKVEWTDTAIRDLEKLDKPVASRIIKKITWFISNSDKVTLEPLSRDFKGMYKLRIGDWRVIYSLKDNYALIQFIGHRKEIYEI